MYCESIKYDSLLPLSAGPKPAVLAGLSETQASNLGRAPKFGKNWQLPGANREIDLFCSTCVAHDRGHDR